MNDRAAWDGPGSDVPAPIGDGPAGEPDDNDLIGCFDALAWAKRFVQRVKENPGIATSEGTMVAWFSSAIMAGYDHALREQREPDAK